MFKKFNSTLRRYIDNSLAHFKLKYNSCYTVKEIKLGERKRAKPSPKLLV